MSLHNVNELTYFYQKVLDMATEGDDVHAGFNIEGTRLSILAMKQMENMASQSMQSAGHGGFSMGFKVKDVDAEYERLKRIKCRIHNSADNTSLGMEIFLVQGS